MFKALISYALCITLALAVPSSLTRRDVTQDVLDDLILYAIYSSALELVTLSCPKPLNSTLVVQVSLSRFLSEGAPFLIDCLSSSRTTTLRLKD